VRVFYQIWKTPLMTVGGPQIISDAIKLCGGENVFGHLKPMAPTVSVEAVLEADPEAIVATGMGDARPEWLHDWDKWTRMTAVKRGNLFPHQPGHHAAPHAAHPRRRRATLRPSRCRTQPSSSKVKTMPRLPQRIVCLTTETVEVLYALGEQDRIAGISGYTVRPPQARKEKPKVYAFTSGDIDKILAVQPDLVLTFSDLQADIARDLIKAGVPVYAFNMRSVDDILGMVETLGRLVGAEAKAAALVGELEAQIAAARAIAAERIARRATARASISRNGTSRTSPPCAGSRS
jgi:ABC-type Fe3+-hydroxamate transport system substrate-binding protein